MLHEMEDIVFTPFSHHSRKMFAPCILNVTDSFRTFLTRTVHVNVHYNDVTINSDVIVVSYRAMFQNGQVGFKWAISLERKSFQVSTS